MGFSQERWFYYLEEHLPLSVQLSVLISGFLFSLLDQPCHFAGSPH